MEGAKQNKGSKKKEGKKKKINAPVQWNKTGSRGLSRTLLSTSPNEPLYRSSTSMYMAP